MQVTPQSRVGPASLLAWRAVAPPASPRPVSFNTCLLIIIVKCSCNTNIQVCSLPVNELMCYQPAVLEVDIVLRIIYVCHLNTNVLIFISNLQGCQQHVTRSGSCILANFCRTQFSLENRYCFCYSFFTNKFQQTSVKKLISVASYYLHTPFNLSLDLMKSNYRRIPSTKNKAKLVTHKFLERHINEIFILFFPLQSQVNYFLCRNRGKYWLPLLLKIGACGSIKYT